MNKNLKIQRIRTMEKNLLAQKTFLSMEEFAVLTGLKRGYIYRLIRLGRLPHFKKEVKQVFISREKAIRSIKLLKKKGVNNEK
jgi:excisionase family DNA binding protein